MTTMISDENELDDIYMAAHGRFLDDIGLTFRDSVILEASSYGYSSDDVAAIANTLELQYDRERFQYLHENVLCESLNEDVLNDFLNSSPLDRLLRISELVERIQDMDP